MGGHNYSKGKDNRLGVTEGGESVGLRHLEGGRNSETPWGQGEHLGDTHQPSSLPAVLYPHNTSQVHINTLTHNTQFTLYTQIHL